MATIPRTYLITSKEGLLHIPPENGQIIALYDADGMYYVAPDDGTPTGDPVLRQMSGVKVVDTLPSASSSDARTDILYANTTDSTISVLVGDSWQFVANYVIDTNVTTDTSNGKFYITGTPNIADDDNGTLLKNANAYIDNGLIYGTLKGNADTATSATKATNDSNDNNIAATYYADVSFNVSTHKLLMTCGDGVTSKDVTIPDTTYNVFSSSENGLTPKTSTVAPSDTTDLILTGSGWLNKANVSVGSATTATTATSATSATTATTATSAGSATNDSNNNPIVSTYFASAAYVDATHEVEFTCGDSTTSSSVTLPVFSQSYAGLVPAASTAGDADKFLRGNGTWAALAVSNYQGATASTDGIAGSVPPALAGEQDYYFKGDGTWGTTFAEGVSGLVPAPTSADANKFLTGNGTWGTPTSTDTTDTTGASNDIVNNLYLTGSRTQQSAGLETTGLATYTNQYVYISGSRLYQSDGAATPSSVAVVDVSSTQALTNKSYEGYTLGDACEATLATTVAQNSNVPTNSAVITYVNGRVSQIQNDISAKASNVVVAPIYDNTQTYAIDDWCMYDDGNGALLYRCTTAVTTAEDFDDTKWTSMNLIDAIKYLIVNS